jgi:hypothetical protein
VLKLRIFPLSLSGTTFTWFISFAPNYIFTWAQLEQKKIINTFTLSILSLDYHILLPLSKNIMSMLASTLGDLGTLETSALT